MSLDPMYAVMLNWNLKDYTIACVESLLEAGMSKEQIVIVDNGSTDDSVVAISGCFGPALTLICNEQNVGFTGGMNIGIERALALGAASVLLLNNDTIVDQAMIDALLAAGETLDKPDILGPAIYYYDNPDRLWWLGDVEHRWLPMPLTVRNIPSLSPFRVDYVTGCAMLVRREVFERIGLFDPRYFIYYEDADFCCRARNTGFLVWCVPQAKMWHKISLTTQRDKPFFHYLRASNQIRFYHEHKIGPSPLLREGYIAFKMAKMLCDDLWHRDWSSMGALWRGIVDGYREQWQRRTASTTLKGRHKDRSDSGPGSSKGTSQRSQG